MGLVSLLHQPQGSQVVVPVGVGVAVVAVARTEAPKILPTPRFWRSGKRQEARIKNRKIVKKNFLGINYIIEIQKTKIKSQK